jgi:hypothetical protein
MAENEAPTMIAPGSAGTAALPQAAPATYPASAPTVAQATYPAATPVEFPAAAVPPPASVPGMPATGVPANAVRSGPEPQEELFGGGRNDPPRQEFLNRLRTPLVAAVAGGVLMLGVGFGAGFIVGRDNPSSAATTGVVQDATGIPGGATGFGNGQGRQGFGGPMGQSGTGGQAQPGTDGTTGTTDSTGLAQTQ